jgi:hypothetical protein
LAVEKWTGEALPEWQAARADWQYSVVNSCGGSIPLTALTPSDALEDLGNERDERETFAS